MELLAKHYSDIALIFKTGIVVGLDLFLETNSMICDRKFSDAAMQETNDVPAQIKDAAARETNDATPEINHETSEPAHDKTTNQGQFGIICIPFCTGGGGQVEIKTNGKYNHRVCVYAELCAWKRLTSYSDIICPNSATVTAK